MTAHAGERFLRDVGPFAFAGQEWRESAACRGADPELFFPGRGNSLAPAKAVCRECPVRPECLEYALANGERQGVWGGTSERERRRIQRRRPLIAAGEPVEELPVVPRRMDGGELFERLQRVARDFAEDWTLVGEWPGDHTATAMAGLLRNRKRPVPPGRFEYSDRRVPGGSRLYARFCGYGDEEATGA